MFLFVILNNFNLSRQNFVNSDILYAYKLIEKKVTKDD